MIGKIGKIGTGNQFSLKGWVATFMFAAIILVFGLTDFTRGRKGEAGTGVAAVVNDTAISLAEYRGRIENMERSSKGQFDQLPEAQRRMLSQQMRRRALDELILGELVYQAASQKGIRASDAEVRDAILEIPFLQENGRFMKDRYRAFLQNMNLSSEDFEHQVRKQLVSQKLQELFVASAVPTREELQRSRALANQKVAIRFVEVSQDDLEKPGLLDSTQTKEYLAANRAQVEKYYADNKVEFTEEERVRARHILIRIDDKRPEAEAQRIAAELRSKVTPENFAQMAAKHSDDPGSKAKGGELGEFGRGRMVPEFEKTAFALSEGRISDPVKTNFGFHIILLEKKLPSLTKPLNSVELDIARKLMAQSRKSEILGGLKALVEKGDRKQVDAWLAKAGLKWQDSGEFDLSTVNIPKLGESRAVVSAIMKKGKTMGMVPELIDNVGRHVVVDVTSWKEVPDKSGGAVDGLERMVAYRKSSDAIENWARDIESRASIQRNPRLTQTQ